MPRVTQEKFGARLATLRKQAGYTQRQVAERLGMSHETLSRLERGQQWTDFHTLVALARIYHVELGQLMRLAEDEGNPRQQTLQELYDLLATASLEQLVLLRDLARATVQSSAWGASRGAPRARRYR